MSEAARPLSASPPEPRWPAWMPDVVWGPLAAGLLILAAGGIGLAFGEPWLFASLGPTAYMIVETPQQPSAKFYNAFIGHMAGLGSAFFALWVLGAWNIPPITTGILPVHVWAGVIAIAMTSFISLLINANHAPATATTLLIALGLMKSTAHTAISIVIGVAIVAGIGEILRLARLKKGLDPTAFYPAKPF